MNISGPAKTGQGSPGTAARLGDGETWPRKDHSQSFSFVKYHACSVQLFGEEFVQARMPFFPYATPMLCHSPPQAVESAAQQSSELKLSLDHFNVATIHSETERMENNGLSEKMLQNGTPGKQ